MTFLILRDYIIVLTNNCFSNKVSSKLTDSTGAWGFDTRVEPSSVWVAIFATL